MSIAANAIGETPIGACQAPTSWAEKTPPSRRAVASGATASGAIATEAVGSGTIASADPVLQPLAR